MSKNTRIITGTTDITMREAGDFMRAQGNFLRALAEKGKGRNVDPKSIQPASAKGGAVWKFLGRGIKASFSGLRGNYAPSDALLKDGAKMIDEIVTNYKQQIGDWATELALPDSLKTERMAKIGKALGADTTAAMIEKVLSPNGPKP